MRRMSHTIHVLVQICAANVEQTLSDTSERNIRLELDYLMNISNTITCIRIYSPVHSNHRI